MPRRERPCLASSFHQETTNEPDDSDNITRRGRPLLVAEQAGLSTQDMGSYQTYKKKFKHHC